MAAPQPTSQPTPPPIASGPSPAVMGTYARQDIVFERGEGAWLIATDGERYLDFGSGVAVNSLGHAHPRLVAALTAQAQKLWHTSNLYRVAGQERLADRLAAQTFAAKVFFCNSGAEACEGAIKAARRFHHVAGARQRNRIITFDGAFHGRTLTAIAAAGNPKYLEGFAPAAPGFDHVRFGDLAAVEAAIGPETAAIMIEPIQGEGGVRVAPAGFLAGLRTLCDQHGLLLVLDEVQTGIGRTGRLFAYEHAGIRPDIMAIAKGLGGGFPVGAFLTTAPVAEAMTAGSHGSTFGGNPLAMSVGNAVLDVIEEPGFLESVEARSRQLAAALAQLAADHTDFVEEVRGQGLLRGLKFRASIPAADVVKAAIGERLLTVGAAENVVRILPPLIVTAGEIDEAASRLARAFAKLSKLKA